MPEGYTNSGMGEPKRDERLRGLLASVKTPDVLPWDVVVALVDAAPGPRRAWYAALTAAPAARYAGALAALLLVATGALAVIPAQASRLGTVVSTELPAAWHPGSAAIEQFQAAAHQRFAALALPQSELYVLNMRPQTGQPKLALVMQNVDAAQAERFFAGLAQSYPALSAFPEQVEPVQGESSGSVLTSLVTRAIEPAHLAGLTADAARLQVLSALKRMGLTPTEVKTSREPDGTLVIKVSAEEMQIKVDGHSQEELQSAGLGDAAQGRE